MEVNKDRRRYILPRTTMKRICSLCLTEYAYYKVKKYKTHPLQLCNKCQEAIMTLAEESSILQRKAF